MQALFGSLSLFYIPVIQNHESCKIDENGGAEPFSSHAENGGGVKQFS